MYQIELKRALVQHLFSPEEGWNVVVHLDPMELAQGGAHPPGKAEIAQGCVEWFREKGVRMAIDAEYGKADLVARHSDQGIFIIEVEGESSKLRTQAFYSALGQSLVRKYGEMSHAKYGLAVPNSNKWRDLIKRMPQSLFRKLEIEVFLVSFDKVEKL